MGRSGRRARQLSLVLALGGIVALSRVPAAQADVSSSPTIHKLPSCFRIGSTSSMRKNTQRTRRSSMI